MKTAGTIVAIAAALACCPALSFAQRAPGIDEAKQALNKKWQKLKPDSAAERDVLFQDVRAGRPAGASYPFKVTALIRDYERGYPPNHYYGRTCVSRIDQEVYTLELDQFNEWDAQGRMTPDMNNVRCANNPAANVSAIPLSSLSGTPAAPQRAAAQQAYASPQASQSGGGIAPGAYQCWGNGDAHLTMNFAVQSGNRYTGYNGQGGSYTLDGSNRVAFRGGPLDGVMPGGFYAVYYVPGGRPTVSFRSPRGTEAAFCQKK